MWAQWSAHHYGIDEAHRLWTVHTAPSSGVGSLTVRKVLRAWFVGTRG